MSGETQQFDVEDKKHTIKLYKRRWYIIILFVFITIMSQIPVFQYSIIANLVLKYYKVNALAVEWTSIASMAANIPMALPAAYLIDRWGLRVSVLIGTFGVALGLITNLFASSRNLFWVILLGQMIIAIAQVPLLTMTPRLAAVWFGPDEISTAASVGVFGIQLGSGFGFLLPSMFIQNHDNIEKIGKEIINFQWHLVGAVIPIAIAILIYFPARPRQPPNPTQLEELQNITNKSSKNFKNSLKSLLRNKGFLIHLLAYCINVGVNLTIGTLLNQIVLQYFPNSEQDVGRMSFCIVVFGMIGSISFGFILDRTKRYKEITIGVFILSFLGLILYMFSLESNSKPMLYFASCVVGLFTSAYTPIAYQFAIELTYPCPEGTTSGFLVSVPQIFAIFFTHLLTLLLNVWGTFRSLSVLAGFLLLGIIMTVFIPNNLRRQAVFKKYKETQTKVMFSPVATVEKIDVS